MPSAKTQIIETIFRKRWEPTNRQIRNSIVTLQDISKAIQQYNRVRRPKEHMSTRNPANFFKDFIRNRKRANQNWPMSVKQAGFTGRQLTGKGRCFDFVPLQPGQTEPFPETAIPGPSVSTPEHDVESASLPLASRRLGRAEETWITQVVVRLRIVETHLVLFSPRRDRIVQVDHLQMSVKLPETEIDALYLATEKYGDSYKELIVSCEAKGSRDDLLVDQILHQVQALFHQPTIKQDLVIPVGLKVVASSKLHVVEFEAIDRASANLLTDLKVASDALYTLHPSVPGLG